MKKKTLKDIMSEIFKWLKDLAIYLLNYFFKKADDYIPDDLGAKFYWPNEADPRDFKVENVLKAPTDEEIKNLPAFVDLLKDATPDFKPVNQWCVPSCTACALSNYMGIQITKEENKQTVVKDWAVLLRQRMWHKWECQWQTGDYLETALKTVKNNKFLIQTWWTRKYEPIKWYAYFNSTVNNIKYWLSKWFPIYYAIRWNKRTWVEIMHWEIKTYNYTPTGWHAITMVGYNKEYLYFVNSWIPNDWDKYQWDYSVFKISWTWFEEMLKNKLANWRWWIVYTKEEEKQFKDYKIDENTEQWQAVKKLVYLWLIKWVPHKDWTYLEPWRWITRLEVIVILYRLLKYLWK